MALRESAERLLVIRELMVVTVAPVATAATLVSVVLRVPVEDLPPAVIWVPMEPLVTVAMRVTAALAETVSTEPPELTALPRMSMEPPALLAVMPATAATVAWEVRAAQVSALWASSVQAETAVTLVSPETVALVASDSRA